MALLALKASCCSAAPKPNRRSGRVRQDRRARSLHHDDRADRLSRRPRRPRRKLTRHREASKEVLAAITALQQISITPRVSHYGRPLSGRSAVGPTRRDRDAVFAAGERILVSLLATWDRRLASTTDFTLRLRARRSSLEVCAIGSSRLPTCTGPVRWCFPPRLAHRSQSTAANHSLLSTVGEPRVEDQARACVAIGRANGDLNRLCAGTVD